MPIKSLLIVVLLLFLIWIPMLLEMYNAITAFILTLSFIIAGFIGEKILNREKTSK